MTKQEIFDQFGEVPLKFNTYYKYVFSFEGTKDEYKVTCSVGGQSEDVYRFNVTANGVETLNGLMPDYINIYKDGELIHTLDERW